MKPNFYGVARISRNLACFDSVKVLDATSTEPFSLPFLSTRQLGDGLHLVAGTIRLVQGRPYACIAAASRAQLPPMLRLAGSVKDGKICGSELTVDISDGDFEGVVVAVAGSSVVFTDLATTADVPGVGGAGPTGDTSPKAPPAKVEQPPLAAATPEPPPVSQPKPLEIAPANKSVPASDGNPGVVVAEPVPLITCSVQTGLAFPVESAPEGFLMPTEAPVRTSAARVTSAAAVRPQKPAPKPAAARLDVVERDPVAPEARPPVRELPRGSQRTPKPLSEARSSQAPPPATPPPAPPLQEAAEPKGDISPGDKENIEF